MNASNNTALLPAGLHDALPPDAGCEAAVADGLMAHFAASGYQRVKPPLIEFEESLLTGGGVAMAPHMFRLMDPESQRMMALRADMTLQVARIATARLHGAARPLRLCYDGEVLRIKGSQLRPERQFRQVGVELIGSAVAAADAEAILLAVDALLGVGLGEVTVDLNLSRLVPLVAADAAIDVAAGSPLRAALDHKAESDVVAAAGDAGTVFIGLLNATGAAAGALDALGRLDLPAQAAAELDHLRDVAGLVMRDAPDALNLTIDPVENRGFEYHTGVGFTLFAPKVRGELGRGGRYLAEDLSDGATGEAATGFTLFMDSVMRGVAANGPASRLFLPFGTGRDAAVGLRAEGWVTVAGLADGDPAAEARRLGCTHYFRDGAAVPLD